MDNLRGAILMVVAMFGFAVEDMFIKQMAGALPVGQILTLLGAGGALIFGAAVKFQGKQIFGPQFFSPMVMARNGCEMFGTVGFVTALALTPISVASAILQATPLVVTMGAALFLGETVGWRRWSAIAVGFGGVLLIIRPGTEDFDPNALFALMAVVGLGGRDLLTRRMSTDISSVRLSTWAFLALVPTGLLLIWLFDQPVVVPDRADSWRLVAAIGIGMFAYYTIVLATRVGDLSFVSPFRYTRLVFALVIGVLAFGERPDALTLTGAAIIVLSGLYSLWRQRRRPASLAEQPLV